jgi:hypothetical protein
MSKDKRVALGAGLLIIALALFCGVVAYAWQGQLGLSAIGLLFASVVAYGLGRKRVVSASRKRVDLFAKVLFTIAGIIALLRHPIAVPVLDADGKIIEGAAGEILPIYSAISEFIGNVDGSTFVMFACVAMAVKFVGVISSAFAWHLLLIGQGIRYKFWHTIMTSFLIGRFIGTFLPSTIGLDGYTLYEAGTYSNQWPRAITAKVLEKFIGITGLFLGMVLTLPFGYGVLVDVCEKAYLAALSPEEVAAAAASAAAAAAASSAAAAAAAEAAPLLATAILAVAGGVSLVVTIGLIRPGLIIWIMGIVGKIAPSGVKGHVESFTGAVGAYRGQVKLLMIVLLSKFVTHFTTAVVYFFTALAIGVVGAQFWPIVFGSTIQIFATIFSPTIAGEGAREAFQSLLLSSQLGGVAPAVLSGALGFIAAEAATMWGGMFLLSRKGGWRPKSALVDGVQVDYSWIKEDDTGFSAEKLAEAKRQAQEG